MGVIDYASGEMVIEDVIFQSIADGTDYVYITANPELDDVVRLSDDYGRSNA